MLEKESGHLVSPMDNRDSSSLNLHPKETNDVQTEYNTLFPLSTSPYFSTAGDVQRAYLEAVPSKRAISAEGKQQGFTARRDGGSETWTSVRHGFGFVWSTGRSYVCTAKRPPSRNSAFSILTCG